MHADLIEDLDSLEELRTPGDFEEVFGPSLAALSRRALADSRRAST